MYFPYIRGRQYELIALRELVEKGILSPHILPIVEPVKLSSTLSKTMEEFIKNSRELGIICNPAVGSFIKDIKDDSNDRNKQKFLNLLDEKCIIKSHIMKENSQTRIGNWNQAKGLQNSDWLIISNNRDFTDKYNDIFSNNPPRYVLIPDEFRRRFRENKVLLEDKFEKCDRNSDYQHDVDEFFSEDHLYYKEEKFIGFGDYSIVGKGYLESGFAPYAVAIHIVYFDDEKNLRVRHFVSDSNEDIQNPAKKFYEALRKLERWVNSESIPLTHGLSTFLKHYEDQTYPGLGSAKKLSLMHHLELMGMYLDGDFDNELL